MANDGPIAQRISVTCRVTRRPRWSVVGRLLDAPDKKIACSVLFLSRVLATRQPPANDSDASGMSQDLRHAPTRAKAFEAARDLAIEALAREAERQWMHGETVSIRVEADPAG